MLTRVTFFRAVSPSVGTWGDLLAKAAHEGAPVKQE